MDPQVRLCALLICFLFAKNSGGTSHLRTESWLGSSSCRKFSFYRDQIQLLRSVDQMKLLLLIRLVNLSSTI
jgi:hypothetical protein